MYELVLPVCIIASAVGAVCGLGGGFIVKPTLDLLSGMPAVLVNFYSGCSVLAMAVFSVLRSNAQGKLKGHVRVDTSLAVGAAVGGLLGRRLFRLAAGLFPDPNQVTIAQGCAAIAVALFAFAYTGVRRRRELRTKHLSGTAVCGALGLGLGTLSSFLGIGGGMVNVAAMSYLFSMDVKDSVRSSLYIILYSQTAALVSTLIHANLEGVDLLLLAGMIACGFAGGALGRKVNAKLSPDLVDNLYMAMMLVIVASNVLTIVSKL